MSITESISVSKFEMLSDGRLQLCWQKLFLKDGVPASEPALYREVREPGDDISDLPTDLIACVQAYWTPERISARQAAIAAESESETI